MRPGSHFASNYSSCAIIKPQKVFYTFFGRKKDFGEGHRSKKYFKGTLKSIMNFVFLYYCEVGERTAGSSREVPVGWSEGSLRRTADRQHGHRQCLGAFVTGKPVPSLGAATEGHGVRASQHAGNTHFSQSSVFSHPAESHIYGCGSGLVRVPLADPESGSASKLTAS